ncbi:MAG: hypothetical protein IKK29_03535 [Christensenellaceae bacterium]|nr:hypothetical protein [Christensenellaceae bacterium]
MNTIKINSGNVKTISHRGISGLERENTCPSFVAACNRTYYGIETDVHVTKDKKFVIIHDETTSRVSLTHDINVEENDYSALENIVLPDLDGSFDRKDIRIPLLQEYIKICKKYEKFCVLEVKNHFEEDDLKKLIDEIAAMDYLDHVIFISFDLDNCINTRKYLKDNDVQWIIGRKEITDDIIQILCDNSLNLDVNYRMVDKALVEKLHSKGIKVNCWTCDDKDDAEFLVGCGVDFITTNILE